jgi:hypothetical protein
MTYSLWSRADADQSFAWVPNIHNFVEPVRATPIFEAVNESFCWDTVAEFHPNEDLPDASIRMVELHHPDNRPDDAALLAKVALADLRGRWDERPSQAFIEATGWNPRRTWAQVAEERYLWTQEQRMIADRLTALGVYRSRRHYAGKGGNPIDPRWQLDASLILDPKELCQIIELAEKGNA